METQAGTTLCLFAALLALLAYVQGHSRFVCPMPMNGNSGNKGGPCGTKDSGQYTTIFPGPMTVRFEETVFHAGAPTSFRLFRRNNVQASCLLLDHMPHSDSWKRVPYCNVGDYPVGNCDLTTGYVTINIPDIECDDCVLQLISVMTDKYTANQVCVEKELSVNCSSYYSCSNVKIVPTEKGKGRGIESCLRYEDNVKGDWPYMNLPSGVYGKEGSLDFSATGWLTGDYFVGEKARYPSAIKPAGPCAPTSSRYGVLFNEAGLVGAVSLVLNDVHLFVSGMVSESLAEMWLEGDAGRLTIPSAIINHNCVDGTLKRTASKAFFSTLHLRLKNGVEYVAAVTPAVVTVALRSGTAYHGEVVYAASGSRAFVIGNLDVISIERVTVNGPGRVSASPLESVEPSMEQRGDVMWTLTEWNVMTGAQELPSGRNRHSTIVYLWIEYAYIEVRMNGETATPAEIWGIIPKPAECLLSDARCLQDTVFRLSPKIASSGGPAVNIYGYGSVSRTVDAYHLTLALVNLADNDQIVFVSMDGQKVEVENVTVGQRDGVAIVAGHLSRSTYSKTVEIIVTTTSSSFTGTAASPTNLNDAFVHDIVG